MEAPLSGVSYARSMVSSVSEALAGAALREINLSLAEFPYN
jgi:hypothetical protein